MASTTFVDRETLIEASWLNDVNAVVYTPGTQTAADIANVPAGSIAATDVQAALNELDTEKQPLDATLTAVAALDTTAGLVEQTGADTFTKTPVSVFIKSLLDDADAATARATLGADNAANLTGDVAAARIMTALNATGTAPVYACRAWVNFNGNNTIAIRASGNVSSITDNGAGDYTVNFTTAMPDANYATVINTNRSLTNTTLVNISRLADELAAPTTTSVRIAQGVPDANRVLLREDASFVSVAIFR